MYNPDDTATQNYTSERRTFWDTIARSTTMPSGMQRFYRKSLAHAYAFVVPEGSRVLELGCGRGDLLASLKPSFGLGVDFSPEMVREAQQKHPALHVIEADVHNLAPLRDAGLADIPFDAIILSDLVNDIWDLRAVFDTVRPLCAPHTRLIMNFHSHLWEHPFQLLQKTKMITPRLTQNWFTPSDVEGVAHLAGFEGIYHKELFLWPWETPGLATLCNRWLAPLWPFSMFTLSHLLVFRLEAVSQERSVSVIIPARNEAGNIEAALQRTPDMGSQTEIIFVEGHSTDNTWDIIQEMMQKYAHRNVKALRQPGKGKGDAVRVGFSVASNDVLMILDADLTMPPESLPQFYDAIASGKAEFVNGVRLVYPQEKKAMRFCNLVANKFFSVTFSWLLGVSIKDTLCGTKVISRTHYEQLARNRHYFGEFDPFGDFDLIFGAAKMHLRLHDIPVRYRDRIYGETNISRWRDGWLLLKMVVFAAQKIKFVK